MRKVAGVLFAAALALPAGAFLASAPGGAAAATPTCKTAAGKATFNPPLPDLTKTTKVKSTLTAVGTVGKCSGGGVTSGKTKFTSPKSKTGANCATLAKPDPKSKGTIGTITITWNNKKTSTAKVFTIKQTPANPTIANTTGKITAGAFKGKSISGQVQYKLPSGACSKGHPLKTVTYSAKKPFVIK
jgi:hypothetical protein